jgi:hypothetical protein
MVDAGLMCGEDGLDDPAAVVEVEAEAASPGRRGGAAAAHPRLPLLEREGRHGR